MLLTALIQRLGICKEHKSARRYNSLKGNKEIFFSKLVLQRRQEINLQAVNKALFSWAVKTWLCMEAEHRRIDLLCFLQSHTGNVALPPLSWFRMLWGEWSWCRCCDPLMFWHRADGPSAWLSFVGVFYSCVICSREMCIPLWLNMWHWVKKIISELQKTKCSVVWFYVWKWLGSISERVVCKSGDCCLCYPRCSEAS